MDLSVEDQALLKSIVEGGIDNEEQFNEMVEKRRISSKGKNLLKGMLRLFAAGKDELPEDLKKSIEQALLTKQETEENPTEDAMDNKVEKEHPEASEQDKPTVEELWKASKQKDEKIVELQKSLQAEVDRRVLKEFVEKAKELPKLSVKNYELGEVLKECSESLSKETFEKLEGILKSANKQISEGKLFAELGTTYSAPNDSEARMDALAEKYASDHKTTVEKAHQELSMNSPEYRRLFNDTVNGRAN